MSKVNYQHSVCKDQIVPLLLGSKADICLDLPLSFASIHFETLERLRAVNGAKGLGSQDLIFDGVGPHCVLEILVSTIGG